MGWNKLSIGLLICCSFAIVESVRVQSTGAKLARGEHKKGKIYNFLLRYVTCWEKPH